MNEEFISKNRNTLYKNMQKRYDFVNKEVKGNWKIMRSRDDKDLPNGFITARNVFATLFEENISKQQLIKLLRN